MRKSITPVGPSKPERIMGEGVTEILTQSTEEEKIVEEIDKMEGIEEDIVIPRLDPTQPTKKQMISREEINIQAMELKKRRSLPPPPGEKCTFDQLDEWLKMLTEDQWSHVAPYIYRLYPIIQRKLSDPNNNIYIDFFTEDAVKEGLRNYIVRRHGGGRYKFIVNDTEKKWGNVLVTGFLDIPIDECMPIINRVELDENDRRNMGYLNLLNNGPKAMQPTTTVNTDTAAVTDRIGIIFKDFMGMYTQLSKDQQQTINKLVADNNKKDDGGIAALLLEKLKQEDPNKQMTMVTGLVTAMKDMLPKQDGNGQMQLIQMMKDSFNSQVEMMKMFFTNQQNQQNNQQQPREDDFLDKLVKYKEALPGLFGSGSGTEHGGKKSTTEVIVEGAKELLLPVIGLTSQFLQLRTGVKPIVPTNSDQANELVDQFNMQPQNMPMGNVNQPPPGANVREMPRLNPTSTPTASNPNPNPTPGQPLQLTIVQQLLAQYGALFLNAIKGGMNGFDMAESVIAMSGMIGTNIYEILYNQGFENIMVGFKSVPEFWQATAGIYGEPYMEQLVKDFLEYKTLEDEINENEDGNDTTDTTPPRLNITPKGKGAA